MNHEEIAKNLSNNIDSALFEQYGAEWKRRAEQAEADRKVLAEELRAWRECRLWTDDNGNWKWYDTNTSRLTEATDASGALFRAKGIN